MEKQINFIQPGALVLHLQKMPNQFHWVYADQALLLAISGGKPIVRGPMGSRLRKIIRISQSLNLVWPLLFLVGLVELIKLLYRQSAAMQMPIAIRGNYPGSFFVGFGAGSENELFEWYRKSRAGEVGKLNQLDVGSLAAWHRVDFVSGLCAFIRSLSLARSAIAALPVELSSWRIDFLTFIGMRVGYFSYMHAWFGMLKKNTGKALTEVAFLAADTPAFAAVNAGLSTCYFQHGLLPYSTLLPDFSRVEALTADEACYMQERLHNAQVTMCPRQRFMLTPAMMGKEILITSIYETADGLGTDSYKLCTIESFLHWASKKNFPVRVRPHPCEKGEFWSSFENNGTVIIEKAHSNFQQTISKIKPRINVSWFSTTLVDALEYGVIPITVCRDNDQAVADIVYPLFQRCLRWPRDAESIERIMKDDEYYSQVLSKLRGEISGAGA